MEDKPKDQASRLECSLVKSINLCADSNLENTQTKNFNLQQFGLTDTARLLLVSLVYLLIVIDIARCVFCMNIGVRTILSPAFIFVM
jgi:hypothetical protein